MNDAIVIRDLTKNFRSVQALGGVSLNVPTGSIYGIVGPNGSGKTTLFSILAGFLKPSSGSFEVLGTNEPSALVGKFTILPQDARFQPNIPIHDQFLFFLSLMGYSKRKAFQEIERVLGIVGNPDVLLRPRMSMSHGQYKRLTVAQCFLGNPELILLDEPTAGLDLESSESIHENIRKLKGSATIVISSHNMEELNKLCDSIAVLKLGKLQVSGKIETIFSQAKFFILKLGKPLALADRTELQTQQGIESVDEVGDGSWRVGVLNAEGAGAQNQVLSFFIQKNYPILSIAEDNVFSRLYKDAIRS